MNTEPLVEVPSADPSHPRWIETLRDRSQVLIRPLAPTDRAAERAFVEGLSEEKRRYRFLGTMDTASERLLDTLTDLDQVHDVAFAAVVPEGAHERIVGVSRYGRNGDGCECAVTVSDDWQDKGLGTALMRHLIDVARARGMHRMYSVDSAENLRMRDLARFLGFHTRADAADPSQVIHELAL